MEADMTDKQRAALWLLVAFLTSAACFIVGIKLMFLGWGG